MTLVFARAVLVLSGLGIGGTGVFLLGDPDDAIGAWLQIGIGVGLIAAATRAAHVRGAVLIATITSLGFLVGHLVDLYGAGTSTVGPWALAPVALMVVLTVAALAQLARRGAPTRS